MKRIAFSYSVLASLLILLTQAGLAQDVPTAATAWQAGPMTRAVAGGAVLENDLIFVDGQTPGAPACYPKLPVVQWGPISAQAPGRYRVSLRARVEKLGASSLEFQAWIPRDNGGAVLGTTRGELVLPVVSRKLSASAFQAAGQWQDLSFEFDVEKDRPVMVGMVYLAERTSPAGKVQVEKASLRLEKLDVPVFLSWSRPKKLRYKHAEEGSLEIRLSNPTGQAVEVEVRPVVLSEEDEAKAGAAVKFSVPAGGTLEGAVPFDIPKADGGYEVIGELLRQGKVLERRGDVFAVSDDPYRCMIQGDMQTPYLLPGAFPLGLKGFRETVLNHWEPYVRDCRTSVELARSNYTTYFEYFAWAREDAMALAEDSDEPYLAGQCEWPVSRKQILMLNDLLRVQGMVPSAYVNANPFGWPAFELIRRRPEWFGGTAAFDTASLEAYNRGETGTAPAPYPNIEMSFEKPSAVDGKTFIDFHIEQLLASAKLYGWESFRYDAGPLPQNLFPRVKERLAQLHPPVGTGNNMGICVLGSLPSPKWKTYCENASLMMEENTRNAFDSATDVNRRWKEWIAYLRQSSNLARSNGAHYTFINSRDSWYASALGYAMGGHPCSCAKSPYGDNERFMLRYGSVFWDLRTQMLPDAEKTVKVRSARPVWCGNLVSQRTLSNGRRQVIVPVFNPPVEPEVVGTTLAAPADGVTVVFTPKAGETVTPWLLAPEPDAHRQKLTSKVLPNGDVEVVLPRFWVWSNVVFDCQGK